MRVYSQSFGFNMHRHIHFVTTNYKKRSTQLSLGLFGDVSHTHTHTHTHTPRMGKVQLGMGGPSLLRKRLKLDEVHGLLRRQDID